jgi:hypothetical protein
MEKLEMLEAELRAIAVWDADYYREKTHAEIDEDAYQIRKERRREIMQEIQLLRSEQVPAIHSSVGAP